MKGLNHILSKTDQVLAKTTKIWPFHDDDAPPRRSQTKINCTMVATACTLSVVADIALVVLYLFVIRPFVEGDDGLVAPEL